MLLKALYDLAQHRGLFESVHLQSRDIHLLIPINEEGELTQKGVIPLFSTDEKGKNILGQKWSLPRFPGENNGGKAYFLADSCLALLGIDKKTGDTISLTEEGKAKNSTKTFFHFWERVELAFTESKAPELAALLNFRKRYFNLEGERLKHSLPFIEIRLSEKGKPEVGALTSTGEWKRLEKLTLSFQVGERIIFDGRKKDSPLVKYWQKAYAREAFVGNTVDKNAVVTKAGVCLVSGKITPAIARSHKPKILGIPGVSSGGYIVSFAKECPAFSSYGFEMGENAPVSEEAAASYALALQSLIDNENTSFKIGSLCVCFWARESEGVTDFLSRMLHKPDPLAVANFLKSPWAGIERHAAKLKQFYSITLSGNAGRIVIRHWMQTTVEQAMKNFANWFYDLDIVDIPVPEEKKKKRGKGSKEQDTIVAKDVEKMPPLALLRLACTTVREAKDLQSEIPAQLYRAALEGTAPSIMLIKLILHRLEADLHQYGMKTLFDVSRFALLKLILNRNRKEGDPMIEPKVFETDDKAYNCGRLLAVLAEIQAKAHDYKLEGAGVSERYFGIASVSPASVFPLLLRLNRHHLDKIRKSSGSTWNQESNIQEILCRLVPEKAGEPPQFPRHLDLQAQGRFALGFYQQKAEIEKRKQEARITNATAEKEKLHDQE
ncbi:MAG: type I-C CRISPR-associated protein Cas8c/Csd1 [Dissulfurimicrobium sp.]|uniref:type I-C CRISPR-associated protein Cas8c/Csd1 n=1 Tax=Dissulfurimicrobium sp. TaxID=2022436 RepID=UPI004049A966